MKQNRRGFTLLEVLVAATIMAIAVTGLLANLRTSILNTSRLSDHDRAAMLARRQMDSLVASRNLPKGIPFGGVWPLEANGGVQSGWQARVTPFEFNAPPGAPLGPGQRFVERIELQVWWGPQERRRSVVLETFRTALATPADAQAAQTGGAGAQVLRQIR